MNLLLQSLRPFDLRLIEPHLQQTRFGAGEVLLSPRMKVAAVIFPETLFVSFRDHQRVEVGLVGREGMLGWPLLLGSDHSQLTGIVNLEGGTALTLSADRLFEACRVSVSLNQALLRFVDNFMAQMACTIGSNAAHPVERRVARWLLMLHDRSAGNSLALTHDHLGGALHVRRATITDCLHILEGDGLLRCRRGHILIEDRAGLEQVAGAVYGTVEAQYASAIGPFGKTNRVSAKASTAVRIPE